MSETNPANRQIARAAGTVMAAFILSNMAGLARQILVANAYGTSDDMEAFNAANRVSETLFNLVAGGALASAFIPTFTGLLAQNERDRAWRLASAVMNLALLLVSLLAALAAIFAPWVVEQLLAPGFSADPEKYALTVDLLRIMLPSAVIFGLSGLAMSILNSHQIFIYPALAPAMYQGGLIFGVTVLRSFGIYGLAWGVVIGAGLHLLLQVPPLLRLGGAYHLNLGRKSPDIGEVVRLMGPRLLGVAVVQLNFWINTRLASQFIEGSVTGIVLAFSLMLLPQAAIAQSIAIAAMPTLSAQVALGKLDEMRRSLSASLRGALVLSIPASIGLVALRRPIVTLLYQRGEFTAQSTELVAWALLWYGIGLIGHALVEILSRAFYSLHDTRTPVLIGVMAMGLNVAFSYLFSDVFLKAGWMPHGGLALANTVATGVEAGALYIWMRRRVGGLNGRNLLAGVTRSGLAALVMLVILLGWLAIGRQQPLWLQAAVGAPLGVVVYGSVARMMHLDELEMLVSMVKRRLVR